MMATNQLQIGLVTLKRHSWFTASVAFCYWVELMNRKHKNFNLPGRSIKKLQSGHWLNGPPPPLPQEESKPRILWGMTWGTTWSMTWNMTWGMTWGMMWGMTWVWRGVWSEIWRAVWRGVWRGVWRECVVLLVLGAGAYGHEMPLPSSKRRSVSLILYSLFHIRTIMMSANIPLTNLCHFQLCFKIPWGTLYSNLGCSWIYKSKK